MNLETELENNKHIINIFTKLLNDNKSIRLLAQRINNSPNDLKIVIDNNKVYLKPIEINDLISGKRIMKVFKYSGTKPEAIIYIKGTIDLEIAFLRVLNNNLIKLINRS